MTIRTDIDDAFRDDLHEIRDGVFSASFVFDPGLSVFAGHFPGNPLLPGIMEIEIIRRVAEAARAGRFRIDTVSRAKFTGPIRPGDVISVEVALKDSGPHVSAAGTLSVAGDTRASINLLLLTQGVRP